MNVIAQVLSRWATRRRATALKRRFVRRKSAEAVDDWLAYAIDHDMPMGMEEKGFREALFGMDAWPVSGAIADFLFAATERYLAENCRPDHRALWQAWVRVCRLAKRKIDVTGPRLLVALREAQNQGLLEGLPAEDRAYLLELYREAYAAVLGEGEDPSSPDLMPLLLGYASVLHEAGSDATAGQLLRRLSRHLQVRPRSIGALSDEESLACPECGVGSPHRIGVTIYHDQGSAEPVRITGAGTTADATLTAQLFTNVFAAALTCNSEPTLVTTAAWSLSMTPGESPRTGERGALVSAVLTPAGPGEPAVGAPTIGMTPGEALSIIADSFDRLQEATGLVRVMRWENHDAEYVEERIRLALAECREGTRTLGSEPSHSEGASVIHVMPLLCRTSADQVVPVEIDIPYDSLGPRRVFDLLREARSAYMSQLVSAAHSREAYAREAKIEQGRAIEHWAGLSDRTKEEFCRQHPTVTITMAYNWDLGTTVPLPSPEEVPRRVYEEQQRPRIREAAERKEKEYAAIAAKLKDMDQPGGRADILTFKLLVDSMIRRANIPIPGDWFQKEYRNWVGTSSAPTWAAVTVWARDHGLPVESLAADNVYFNARLRPDSPRVIIQPMVVIDLHDFLVRIDGAKGVMEVFPGGKTAALANCLVPDEAHGIANPADLHAQFVGWMRQRFSFDEARSSGEAQLTSEILADDRIGVMVRLAQAKRALFRGDADEALRAITEIRRLDLAPVYFWGAVAEQYKHLSGIPLSGLSPTGKRRRDQLLNLSASVVIEFIKSELLAHGLTASATQVSPNDTPIQSAESQARAVQARSLITRQAQDYLGQLGSRDPEFAATLASDDPDISVLERESFALSAKDEAKYSAAIAALSALELLNLAEETKDVARRLPFSGRPAAELRRDIEKLIQMRDSLSLAPPPSCLELDELQRMVQ